MTEKEWRECECCKGDGGRWVDPAPEETLCPKCGGDGGKWIHIGPVTLQECDSLPVSYRDGWIWEKCGECLKRREITQILF
jgi:hypothetical protein